MSDKQKEKDRLGSLSAHPQHRAGEDEGARAPLAKETGRLPEQSIFDGAGNEIIVVTGTDDDGRRKQGTGKNREEATKDVFNKKEPIGGGFGTVPEH